MSGPPMHLMATLEASTHRSACEIMSGQYFLVIGSSRLRATVGRPALAPKVPSPASVKRITAFGQPPVSLPVE